MRGSPTDLPSGAVIGQPGGFWQVLAACVGGGGEGAATKETKEQWHSFSA